MRNSALPFRKTQAAIAAADLTNGVAGWLLDGEIRQHSAATLALRRHVAGKLLWFLEQRGFGSCGTQELRLFLAYVAKGHEQQGGRWGDARQVTAPRPSTVQTYHRHLRTLFRWLAAEELIAESPMEAVPAPVARPDQIQPFAPGQVKALIAAAKKGRHPRRDEALLLFLLDTGLRATELCSLRAADLDMQNRRVRVLGKGGKYRTVPFGGTAAKAVWQYLKGEPRDPGEALFLSERGDPLTRSGLLQLLERLGEAAGLEAVRCSPHTLRHTFAVEFLRAGGNVFTLQQLLGHTTLAMTNRYVALAQADLEAQHRRYSPADRLRAGR